MANIQLVVGADPDDGHALQAWVDAMADEVPLRLLLDTGTYRSALPHVEPFASRAKRVTVGGQGVFGVAVEEVMVEVDSLRIGDVVTGNLVVQLQPRGWRHPALLGMDVMGSHRCTFHFGATSGVDLDSLEPPDQAWFPLASEPHRTPTVEMLWDRTALTAIWDTGAGVTLVDQAWARRHGDIVVERAEAGRGIDITGAQSAHPWGTMAPCRIGGVEFPAQNCGIVDFSAMNATLASPIAVIIGLPLIAQASWCMDFPGRRFTVEA